LAYQSAGRNQEAKQEFEDAVQIAPSYDASNANLGCFFLREHQFDKALEHFATAVRVNPHAAFHHGNLSTAYFAKGQIDDAIAQLRQAIEIEPDSPVYHQRLAGDLYQSGKVPEAIAELYEVIRLSPADPVTRAFVKKDIAWRLATHPDASIRNGKEAVALAEDANQIAGGRNAMILLTLSAAYAETGRFDEAKDKANEALKVALQQNNQPLAGDISRVLRIYASGSPFREAPARRPAAAR
jgi:Flp pilus assembly protein TadD